MGMYNEVFKKCPSCGGIGYMQISQIVLGFGGFDLDKPSTLADLSLADLQELQAAIKDDWFQCIGKRFETENGGCGHRFRLLPDEDRKARQQIIRELTGCEDEDA